MEIPYDSFLFLMNVLELDMIPINGPERGGRLGDDAIVFTSFPHYLMVLRSSLDLEADSHGTLLAERMQYFQLCDCAVSLTTASCTRVPQYALCEPGSTRPGVRAGSR